MTGQNPSSSDEGLYALKEQLAAGVNCSAPNRPFLLGINEANRTLALYRPDCGLWSCPQCAIHNRRRWLHTIMFGIETYKKFGESWSFATLTANRWRRGFSKSREDWARHWPKLHKRIRRYLDGKELHYVMLPELHSDGTMHMHSLWSAVFEGKKVARKKDGTTYYRSKWLADNGAESGLGYVHDNRPLKNTISAAAYVTKYITKSIEYSDWPRSLRRVRTSQHWPKHDEKLRSDQYEWSEWFSWYALDDELRWRLNNGYTVGDRTRR